MATDIIARGLAARLTSGPNGTIPEKFLPKFPMDKEMSDTSTNAVENRVIKQYVDNSAGVQPDYNQNDSTARDYIKNRPFYDESSLTEIADFKVISGDINAIGSTMVVQYNGKEYTETVKDAAEAGSSKHIPYIGFKFEEGVVITEEHPFSYGVGLLDTDNPDSNRSDGICILRMRSTKRNSVASRKNHGERTHIFYRCCGSYRRDRGTRNH